LANTQSMERPGSLGGLPSLKTALAAITGVMMLVDLYLIFMVAPTDSVLGHVQRVFYFHVPIAIMSFLAFFVVFIGSLMYLIKRTPKWDAVAHASAEVGVVFVTLALLTGIIWARPVWNTWWTWEPRLTTTMILWLIYVAYLMVRSYPSPKAPSTPRSWASSVSSMYPSSITQSYGGGRSILHRWWGHSPSPMPWTEPWR